MLITIFSQQGFFPSEQLTAFPVSGAAKRFLEVGPTVFDEIPAILGILIGCLF